MPLQNPSPCMPLQTTTKVISAVQALIGVIRFILFIVWTVNTIELRNQFGSLYSTFSTDLAILIVFAVIQVIIILVAILLFMGASKGNVNHLLIWVVVTGIVMFIEFWAMIRMDPGAFVSFFLNLYFMWVVYAFRTEVMGNPGPSSNPTSV